MDAAARDRVVGSARRRALAALVAMGAGFLLARAAPGWVDGGIDSGAWLGVSLLAGAAVLGTRGRVCAACLWVMALTVAGGWFTLRTLESPADRLVLPAEPVEAVVRVEGIVVEGASVPVARGALARFVIGGTSTRFVVRVTRVEEGTDAGMRWRRASGRLVVHADGPVDAPVGRRARLTGRASGPGAPTNPGQSDQRLWAAQEGVVGTMTVPDAALIAAAAGRPGVLEPLERGLRGGRAWLAARARAGIGAIEDDRARALVASLLLGAEEEEGRAISTQFQRLGLAHILAISGVHVAMLAWATLLLVRLCGDFGALEPCLAAGAVGLYLLVVPAEAPIVRSGVMVLALLLGEAFGRRYDGVVILAWTAAVLLLVRPMDLWSLGFQLSFGVTGVLLGAGRVFHERLWGAPSPLAEVVRDPAWWRRGVESGKRAVSASLLAWTVASPWIAARVGLFSPVAPLSSLVVGVPVSALMLVGFLALLVGTFVPGGTVVWMAAEPIARVTLACVDWLDGVPGSSIAVGSIPLAWGGAASVGVLWLLGRGSLRGGPDGAGRDPGASWIERRRVAATWGIGVALGAWLLLVLLSGRTPGRDVALRIDTLDVGDATCHVIRCGDEALLWDCGSSWAGAGEVRIPGAIRALGVPPVRTAVVTHANFDHFNALPDVAWRLGVRRLVVSGLLLERARSQPGGATAAMLGLLRDQGVEIVTVAAGQRMRLGEAELEFLWPREDEARSRGVNDQSLVARIEVGTDAGARRLLLTGDVQARAIAGLLGETAESRGALGADVLEAPHHGAFSREAAALVEAVGPRIIVQSTGRTRAGLGRVGDARWAEPGGAAQWLTTAIDGAVWVELRRDGTIRSGPARAERSAPASATGD